ncbi:MAG: alpha/beta fold hydrolase, partial [Deltaproteobacteria bacterium]|nr:alpha/beta fold hydrolase [Deltaproteobacteria bacterium]
MAVLEPIVGRYLRMTGTRIFFDEIGSGIPMVCIHTAGANSLEYRELLPLLAGKGFWALAPDLPGHGRSYLVNDEPFRDMHPYAEFVWSFVQEVCEKKPVITGCSVGGSMTLDLVAHHSEEIRAAIAMEGAARTPVYPDTSIAEQPAWFPGWQAGVEIMGAPSSLNRNASATLIREIRYVHRNAQLVGA